MATVIIQNKAFEVIEGHSGKPDLQIFADTRTWLDFLAKEKNLFGALLSRKIRIIPVVINMFRLPDFLTGANIAFN